MTDGELTYPDSIEGTKAIPAENSRGARASLGIVLCLMSMSSVQFGAAFSTSVTDVLGTFGTTWLRLCWAAVFLAILVRPPLHRYSASQWLTAVALGSAMAMMTMCFFAAIERIPLGLAVAIDFLGPLAVATFFGGFGWRLVWPVVAGAGVLFLAWDGNGWIGDAAGLLFAFGAAFGWGSYIVLMKRAGETFKGLEGLTVSLIVAAVVALPFGLPNIGGGLTYETFLLTGVLAILVPLLPYALEFIALRRMDHSSFGILMSIEPAIGALAGFAVLGQSLNLIQMVGTGFVVAASAGVTLSSKANH
jgi:inner membrane transporter RhtA